MWALTAIHASRMNDQQNPAADDVRMRGFARRHTVEAAIAWLDDQLQPLGAELLPLPTTAGRVLAGSVASEVDVPGFDRATMDGYAVVAESTEGATPYNSLPLTLLGDSLPGRPFQGAVGPGQAVRIMTGAPLPLGCDAVLPAEWAEDAAAREAESSQAEPDATGSRSVRALAAVSPGKHVGRRGEDVTRGTTLLQGGRLLRPQDLGLLSSVGVRDLHVIRRPRVRLVVTGNRTREIGRAHV